MRVRSCALLGIALLLGAVSPSAAASDAPLADAAEKMDRAAVRALLGRRADVRAAQIDGMTALHWAAYHDDLEIAKLLLGAGADCKTANRYGVTPLSLACTNGSGAMVELLLGAGADPNTALPGGETALMTAARTGRLEPVRALLARGADVAAKESRRGQTALMWAAAEGHAAVVEELIKAGADFRARLDTGFTPLLFAVREGRIGVVRALLKAGASVNERLQAGPGRVLGGRRAPPGASALLLAVANGHFELASVLLDLGADPNADHTGYTVLHAITAVRKPGVGDNDPAPEGSGAVTSLELVKKLAAKGANLNARMTKRANLTNTRLKEIGATPFMLAAQTADAELMRALAALGADPLLANDDGTTPLMAAAGIATRSPGEDAGTESEVLEAVKLALELGADVNAVDKNGETAMHGAAYKNLPQVVQFLADRGARIDVWNRKNRYGWTPLLIAEGYRHGNFKPSTVTVDVPDVPALKDNTVDGNLSVRKRLAEHRTNAACASCHNLMDPVGLSLEKFDAIGRWRTAEGGAPIDASGSLPDGSRFADVHGLEQALLKRPELFVGTVAEKLLTYALGRGVDYYDAPSIRRIVRDAGRNGHRFSSIILGVARSIPFQMRRSQG